MVTTHVLATPDAGRAAAARRAGILGIGLYQVGREGEPGAGHELPRMAQSLPRVPTARAWDFLSIALAVHCTDRFVLRDTSADAWTRMISLEVEVADPKPWVAAADRLNGALRFLTGDIWRLSFKTGGAPPPQFQPRLTDRDSVSLFSGGLDSLIGALDLQAAGRRPLLISQASAQEGPVQKYLAGRLGLGDHRFGGRATERNPNIPAELSSRARSILFIAYGIVAAVGLSNELIIPENGLISINPPLTRRRLGSLSTRTTHPFFIAELQQVLDAVGLRVRLHNPYGLKTKGEMLQECADGQLGQLAPHSYSCGKGKRLHQQCGVCVPCLIRRASFHHAGMVDGTNYRTVDLTTVPRNDDIYAARMASAALGVRSLDRWVAEAGPLPHDPAARAQYVDVVRRGLFELKGFIDTFAWP